MYWFAPETLRAMEFTYFTDIWSYGATIWELLTRGKAPFAEFENWSGTKFAIIADDVKIYCLK